MKNVYCDKVEQK